eukprot:1492909-Prymnesium_polylepis.1
MPPRGLGAARRVSGRESGPERGPAQAPAGGAAEVAGADCTLRVGTAVRTFFAVSIGGDDRWYTGTIVEVFSSEGRATVRYDSGNVWIGEGRFIFAAAAEAAPAVAELAGADATLRVGSTVRTFFAKSVGGDDRWYSGVVTDIFPDTKSATIRYDAGNTWTGEGQFIFAATPTEAPAMPTGTPATDAALAGP